MQLLIGYSKAFPLAIGGQIGKSTFAIGDAPSVHLHTMGGGGSNFRHFGVYVLIKRPLISFSNQVSLLC